MGFALARTIAPARSTAAVGAELPPMPAPRRRADGVVAEALTGPLDLDRAVARLGDQPALGVPAKLALLPGGRTVLCAEIPQAVAGSDGADPRLDAVLAVAWGWLHGRVTPLPAGNGTPGDDDRLATARPQAADARRSGAGQPSHALETALAVLGWASRPEGGGYVVRTGERAPALRIELLGTDWLRVSRDPLPMRVPTRQVAEATALFALEASARLRLARVAVRAAGDVVHVSWDAVVGVGDGLASWLGEAAEALGVAHDETMRALRALTVMEVAAAYLRMCDPRR